MCNQDINLYFDLNNTEKIQNRKNNKFAHDPPAVPSRHATGENPTNTFDHVSGSPLLREEQVWQ